MAKVFKMNHDGTIEIAKISSKSLSYTEFFKNSRPISLEKFLKLYKGDVKSRLQDEIQTLQYYHNFGVSGDVIGIGPRVYREASDPNSYYVESFVIGTRVFNVSDRSGTPIYKTPEEKQNLIDSILEYGVTVFGKKFIKIVEDNHFLDFDYIASHFHPIDPSHIDNRFIYCDRKTLEILPDSQQHQLRELAVQMYETIRKLTAIRSLSKPFSNEDETEEDNSIVFHYNKR